MTVEEYIINTVQIPPPPLLLLTHLAWWWQIEEKYMNGMEDEDQVAKEAGKYLDQVDSAILVSERPDDADLGIISDPENYLLDRYFKVG